MDVSLPSYEAAMREAREYLRRRDLSSQDEVPLYFAWERLYAATNANLSTDFLQESRAELRARQYARLAPRRGLPPPLFTSFDKVNRSSAQASAFLRTGTSSDAAIEMMARRYRREAEKLRTTREKLAMNSLDGAVKRLKKGKRREKSSDEEVEELLEAFEHSKVLPEDKFRETTTRRTKFSKADARLGDMTAAKAAELRKSSFSRQNPAAFSNVADVATFAAQVSDWRMRLDGSATSPLSKPLRKKKSAATSAKRLGEANEVRGSAHVEDGEGDMTFDTSFGSSSFEEDSVDSDGSHEVESSGAFQTNKRQTQRDGVAGSKTKAGQEQSASTQVAAPGKDPSSAATNRNTKSTISLADRVQKASSRGTAPGKRLQDPSSAATNRYTKSIIPLAGQEQNASSRGTAPGKRLQDPSSAATNRYTKSIIPLAGQEQNASTRGAGKRLQDPSSVATNRDTKSTTAQHPLTEDLNSSANPSEFQQKLQQKLVQLSHAVGDMQVKIQGKQIEVTFKGELNDNTELKDGEPVASAISLTESTQPSVAQKVFATAARDEDDDVSGAEEEEQSAQQLSETGISSKVSVNLPRKQSSVRFADMESGDHNDDDNEDDGVSDDYASDQEAEQDNKSLSGVPNAQEDQPRQIRSSTHYNPRNTMTRSTAETELVSDEDLSEEPKDDGETTDKRSSSKLQRPQGNYGQDREPSDQDAKRDARANKPSTQTDEEDASKDESQALGHSRRHPDEYRDQSATNTMSASVLTTRGDTRVRADSSDNTRSHGEQTRLTTDKDNEAPGDKFTEQQEHRATRLQSRTKTTPTNGDNENDVGLTNDEEIDSSEEVASSSKRRSDSKETGNHRTARPSRTSSKLREQSAAETELVSDGEISEQPKDDGEMTAKRSSSKLRQQQVDYDQEREPANRDAPTKNPSPQVDKEDASKDEGRETGRSRSRSRHPGENRDESADITKSASVATKKWDTRSQSSRDRADSSENTRAQGEQNRRSTDKDNEAQGDMFEDQDTRQEHNKYRTTRHKMDTTRTNDVHERRTTRLESDAPRSHQHLKHRVEPSDNENDVSMTNDGEIDSSEEDLIYSKRRSDRYTSKKTEYHRTTRPSRTSSTSREQSALRMLETHEKTRASQRSRNQLEEVAEGEFSSDEELSEGPDTPYRQPQHRRHDSNRKQSDDSRELFTQNSSGRLSSRHAKSHSKRRSYSSESSSDNDTKNSSEYDRREERRSDRIHRSRTRQSSQPPYSTRNHHGQSQAPRTSTQKLSSHFIPAMEYPPRLRKPNIRLKRDIKTKSEPRSKEVAGKPHKLPEGIVWPPGMEDECIARLGLDGHHPIAPPGLEHLVTEEQWGDYWTWLHWYSSWQMWYLKNGKKPKRKSEKRNDSRHADTFDSPDFETEHYEKHATRNANWWVDTDPDKQHSRRKRVE